MSKRTSPNDKILVDQVFSIPKGAEDSMVRNLTVIALPVPTDAPGVGVSVGPPIEVTTDSPFYLQSPDTFSVIDQRLRRAPGGQMLVDIVLQTEDIIGANEYEVQLVKVP